MSFIRVFAALVLVSFFATTTVQAQIAHETKIRHYKIRGKTPLGLVNGMFSKGKKTNGRVRLASLRTKVDYSAKIPPNSCRNWKIALNAKFLMKLPTPRHQRKLPKQTARKFDHFYKFLKTHEETHRRIMVQCLARLQNRANRLLGSAKSCPDLLKATSKLEDVVKSEAKRCRAKHEALDRRDEPKLSKTALYKAAKSEAKKAGRRANAVPRVGFAYRPTEFNQRK